MTEDEIKAIQADNAKLKSDIEARDKRIAELAKKEDPPPEDPGLLEKAKKEKEENDKRLSETKQIENAVGFNHGLGEFTKAHKDILPSDVENILKTVGTQNFDTAVQKANAIRAAFVEAFFSVQDNLDLLTVSQQEQFKDFLKLTVNGKQAKAEHVYENIFEPAIISLKKIRKAEELVKSKLGITSGSAAENAYKDRLIAGSRKTYLGEKGK